MTHVCCLPTRQCRPCERRVRDEHVACSVHRYDIPDRLLACTRQPHFSLFLKGIENYWKKRRDTPHIFRQQDQERLTRYLDNVTEKQRHSIRSWVYHNHMYMNQWCSRYGHTPHHPKKIHVSMKHLSNVSTMCSILQRTIVTSPPIVSPLVVYKGMTKQTMEGLIQFDSTTKLLIWTGFVATSLHKTVSQNFKGGTCCETRIFIPKGSHVLYCPWKGEDEMILPAFSVFYSMKDDPMTETNDWIYLGVRHEMKSLPSYTTAQLEKIMDSQECDEKIRT